jgi:hypothetical protein
VMAAPFNTDAVLEDLTWLADHGVGATEAARRTGFASKESLDTWMRRHTAVELLNRLTRQDPTTILASRKAS